jgi:hypothetical protein
MKGSKQREEKIKTCKQVLSIGAENGRGAPKSERVNDTRKHEREGGDTETERVRKRKRERERERETN